MALSGTCGARHGGPGKREPARLEGLILTSANQVSLPTVLEPPKILSPTGESSIQNLSLEGTLQTETIPAVTITHHSLVALSSVGELCGSLSSRVESVTSPIGVPFLSFLDLATLSLPLPI